MTNKKTILSLVAIFAALFLMSFTSAVILNDFPITATSPVSHNAGTFPISFTLTNTDTAGVVTLTTLVTSGTATIALPDTVISMADGPVSVPITGTVTFGAHQSGPISATITAHYDISTTKDSLFSVSITPSSTLSVTSTQSLTKTQGGIITITNTGNTNLGDIVLSASGDFNVSLSQLSILNLAAGSSSTVNVASLTNLSDRNAINLGPNTVTILAKDVATNTSGTLDYTVYKDFCDYDNINTSRVDVISVEDKSSSNEWEWKPLDDVTVSVEVENNMGDDKDFVAEIALWDSEKHKFVDLNDESSLTEDLSIDDGDSEKASFDFQVPIELEDSDGRYVLYVKAYVDGKEKSYCNSYSAVDADSSAENIQITKKEKDVILGDISVPDVVKAGDTVTISARAFNIGSSDQDKVMAELTNTQLGLVVESSSFSLDSGDSNAVDFTFVVPADTANGVYTLKLYSSFDYKKSTDYYAKDEEFDVKLTISGGVTTTTTGAGLSEITAVLNSDAKAGSDLEITTTIKNLGSVQATFTLSALDYDSWATLNSISDRTLILGAGESQDITISLNVNDKVSGAQTFKIESKSGTKLDSRTVSVEISGGSWLSSLESSLGGNSTLWIIGAVNLILILLVIFLAIKVSRR